MGEHQYCLMQLTRQRGALQKLVCYIYEQSHCGGSLDFTVGPPAAAGGEDYGCAVCSWQDGEWHVANVTMQEAEQTRRLNSQECHHVLFDCDVAPTIKAITKHLTGGAPLSAADEYYYYGECTPTVSDVTFDDTCDDALKTEITDVIVEAAIEA